MAQTTEPAAEQQAFAKLLNAYKVENHHLTIEAEAEHDIDASIDRLCLIERQIWQTPAPDLRAVLAKVEIATRDKNIPPPQATASIIADLRRFSGETVSPLFQPDLWLAQWEKNNGSYLVRDGEALICGDPTNQQHRRLTREMEKANGTDAVKAMVMQCCKGLPEGVAA